MSIRLEILQYSYWEHFKAVKELALIFPPDHFKRILLQKEIDKILLQIKLQINQQYENNTYLSSP